MVSESPATSTTRVGGPGATTTGSSHGASPQPTQARARGVRGVRGARGSIRFAPNARMLAAVIREGVSQNARMDADEVARVCTP